MADPATMTGAMGGGGGGSLGGMGGPGAKLAGSVLGAIGQLNEGTAGKAMYQYKAGMALRNRDLALQTADYTRKMGEVSAGEAGLKGRFQFGKILTGEAATGVDVNSGSPLNVRRSQTQTTQIDEGLIRANAARRAYGYDVEAAKYDTESKIDVIAGDQLKSASKLAAATSILGGSASVADKWSQASQYGLYSGSGPTFSGDGSQSSMGGGAGGGNFS